VTKQVSRSSARSVNTYQGFHLPLGLIAFMHWVAAMVSVTVALAIILWSKSEAPDTHYRLMVIGTLLVSYPIYSALSVYSFESTRASLATKISSAWVSTGTALMLLAFISGTSATYPAQVIAIWFVVSWIAQIAVAIALKEVVRAIAASRATTLNALVIGTGDWATSIATQVLDSSQWHLIGVIDETNGSSEGPVKTVLTDDRRTIPVIGKLSQLRSIVEAEQVRRIFIALPADDPMLVQELYVDLLDTTADVVWVVRPTSMVLFNPNVDSFEGARAVYLNASPLTSYPSSVFVKHLADRLIALGLLIALSPFLVLLAIGVKLSSKGPVFFVQERHGLNGNTFNMWKFRSMRLHEDKVVKQATVGDSRVTAIGRLLRKSSMDELPQLINVLKGDMSLVGPRPHATQHNDYYADKLTAYMARHRVKPGITGLAQVNGFRGETDTIDKMQSRLQYDLEYINNWSLRLDWEILLKTPKSILKHEAY
jgi:putative colanic acid biosynthesis UDP-glucose lipid carrier transferase